MSNSHFYSQEQINFLFLLRMKPRSEATSIFNQTFGLSLSESAICNTYKRYGIKGQDTRFKKGMKAKNKGVYSRFSEKTEFKPGHKPKHTAPIGTIQKKYGYSFQKVAQIPFGGLQKNWKAVHHIVWEQQHGAIPKGHVVIFLDGNPENCDITNLACISKKQHAVLNHQLKSLNNQFFEAKIAIADLILESSNKARLHEACHE